MFFSKCFRKALETRAFFKIQDEIILSKLFHSYCPKLLFVTTSLLCFFQTFLKERFDSEEIKPDLWMSLEGGSTCTECGILAEDTALYFGGSTVRQAITQDLDLRGAK